LAPGSGQAATLILPPISAIGKAFVVLGVGVDGPCAENRFGSAMYNQEAAAWRASMREWRNVLRSGTCAGLLGAAIWLGIPAEAAAQSCSTDNGVYTCTVPAGSFSSQISISAPSSLGIPMQVSAAGTITVPASAQQASALSITNDASSGTSSQSQGANADGLTIGNTGSITLTQDQTSINAYVFGLYSRMTGGQGFNGNPGKNQTSNGGNTAQLSLTNSGVVTINLPNVQISSGGALYALSTAGNGGSNGSGIGGAGGTSGGASISNSAAILASLAGQFGFGGIEALGIGGSAGTGDNGTAGGGGGVSTVDNSAPINITWNWQNVGSINFGLYGILAQSKGGNGTGSNGDDNSQTGGEGGSASSASVTLTQGGEVTVRETGSSPAGGLGSGLAANVTGAGVAAETIGGNGGNGEADHVSAGNGGNAAQGGTTVDLTDANVTTSGDSLPGLLALGQGGAGGLGATNNDGSDAGSRESNGGIGGSAFTATADVTAQTQSVQITTTGASSPAIVALLQGGAGGLVNQHVSIARAGQSAGNGGRGGNVFGTDTVTLAGTGGNTVKLMTTGSDSPGIDALSQGGAGGMGGTFLGNEGGAQGGAGGGGGGGGTVTVTLQSASISTQGQSALGIFAQSQGAAGGDGGDASGLKAAGGAGGAGGSSGAVTVSLDSASAIMTQGADSTGILAQSLSGAGGQGGLAGALKADGGGGGGSAGAGNVTVTNAGTVSTSGDNARGILAQSLSAIAGGGGLGSGSFFGSGGTGASSGAVGTVTIANTGTISTSGADAEGVLAQSIGGSGGAGGSGSGLFAGVGGNATTNPVSSNAGDVVINDGIQGGSFTTSGVSAIGILGQSIGGGGGDGGGSSGAVSVGASGGGGGNGELASANLIDATITTSGDDAHGLVVQSVGGGGGNAGNASATGLFTSVAIGGSGGAAGSGNTVDANITGTTVTTSGSKAAGLVAQSIGGGGGTGGEAISSSIGPGFDASVAIGGSGGTAGDGGLVQSTVTGGLIATGQNSYLVNGGTPTSDGMCGSLPCNQLPVDDYGVVLQSIGGGGGLGGSATARAIAISVPVSEAGSQASVAAAVALGGTGGTAGTGGAVQFALSNGGQITTSGAGSTAVLVQSIGGGGGAGGDSSALAAAIGFGQTLPEDAKSIDITPTFTLGGGGGGGGNGGPVQVAIGGTISDGPQPDPSGSAATGIETFGDFADGIKAQSIGGGGGDAGFGSSDTQFFGSGNNTAISVSLGSSGGTGGTGGDVEVDLFPSSGIVTFGSGAIGILAQSIGGGGGASQGGSIDVGQTISVGSSSVRPGLKLALGETGGSGNIGGTVSVSAESAVVTHGGDAIGIVAQSIGGGGGLGGSAGADASADNPIVATFAGREGISNTKDFLTNQLSEKQNGGLPFDATFALSIGGTGGTGGNGGEVSVNLDAPISTEGDWADGVVAQSIGAGGGDGGSAAASGTGGLPEVTVNVDVAVGGTGGAGGDGGPVTVNLNQGTTTSVSTTGFSAAGIVAQSVGGGGGIGADGSDSATGLASVGGAGGLSGGSAGNGGTVVVGYWNPSGTTITTSGAASDGVDAQSIGGGGGIAGAGSSLFEGAFQESGSLTLSAGGGPGAGGNGNTVTFEPQGGNDTPLTIQTTGNDSYGILAQSIGGGGGIVTSQPSGSSVNPRIGGISEDISGSGGDGGAVNVTLLSQSKIVTTGIAADGIVAQSIGGGGGVIRLVNAAGDTPGLTTAVPVQFGSFNGTIGAVGSGGAVTIEDDGSVSVTGASAVGILAQSIGGGGGLITDGGLIFAGSPNQKTINFPSPLVAGGSVSVTTSGPISATGVNGIGIFAQSTGLPNAPNGLVSVTVNSSVMGGSGPGATETTTGSSAVVVDTPANTQAGQVTVNAGGSLQTLTGTTGTAVLASGGGSVDLTNFGTITGSTFLNADPGTFNNFGTYNAGPAVQGNLINSGLVNIGGRVSAPVPGALSFATTTVTGNFTQTPNGTLQVGTDFNTGASDSLVVNGQAVVNGSVKVLPSSIVPVAVPVITATDGITGQLTVQPSVLYAYNVQQKGDEVTITPRATGFDLSGFDLNSAERQVANYLTSVFDHAQPGALGFLFADLGDFADAGGPSYAGALGQMAPGTLLAFASQRLMQTQAFANGLFDCRDFAGANAVLTDRGCAYASTIGGTTHQASGGGYGNFTLDSVSWQLGGQVEVAPSWQVSGALAYQEGWLTGTDNTTGDNSTGYFGAGIVHQIGRWRLGLAGFGSFGSTQTTRDFVVPNFETTLSASPEVDSVGGRAQVAYRVSVGTFYIQPTLDLDLIRVHAGSTTEGSVLDAEQLSTAQTTFAATPLMEVGMSDNLSPTVALRSFVSLGVSVPSNDRWQQEIRFAAAPGVGEFMAALPMSGTAGVVNAGVELLTGGPFDLQADYSGVFSGTVASNAIALNAQYQF
jgi:hypothetical protein